MTILGLLTILTSTAYAHQPKPPADRSLQSLERYNVKRLKHATQVIRFFERHPRILNARKTRRKAWRIVHAHQRIVKQATARLIVVRRRLDPLYHERLEAARWAAGSGPTCVRREEGAYTTNTGNGYYGAWQADISFQRTHGREFYYRWGTANNWPKWAQDIMAYRGWKSRGWAPWPNTSVECGLR